jgi:Holliday junction resolvasome RuvABC endonuclease subunit
MKIDWMRYYSHKTKWDGRLDDKLFGVTYPRYTSEEERIYKLSSMTSSMVEHEMKEGHDVLVAIEGYSFGSTGMRLFQIAENTGLLKNMLWLRGVDFKIVAPTTVKKIATGKGNSQKQVVYDSFCTETGLNLHDIFGFKSNKAVNPISDIADGYWLARWRMENQ